MISAPPADLIPPAVMASARHAPVGTTVFLVPRESASFHLRGTIPARWLTAHGYGSTVVWGYRTSIEVMRDVLANPVGTMIIEPPLMPLMEPLVDCLVGRGVILLAERPSWVLPAWHRGSARAPHDAHRRLIRGAAGIIAYSKTLAEALAPGTAPPIAIVPDALESLPPAPEVDRCRIVWAGAETHGGDWPLLWPALPRLLAARPQVRVSFFGGAPAWARVHPQVDVVPMPPSGLYEYPDFLDRLRALRPAVMLWPLADHLSSELRGMSTALNAAAAGAALIVSPRGLYAAALHHGQDVLFADDTSWHEAMSDLLDRPARRDAVAAGLRAWVARYGVIDATGPAWASALTRVRAA